MPSDLSFGDIYRILFVTIDGFPASTLRSANDRVIGAAGTPIDLLVTHIANTFRAVVSTRHVDARVNTGTTYTAADKGVPIYWANGGKVADDYEDFYDGDWDDEANARDEFGDLKALPDGVWTGSGHDGTELFDGTVSRAFGQGETGYGTPGSVTPGAGPLYSGSSADRAEGRPLYGLSLELRVAFPLLASSVGSFEAELSDSAAARSQRFATGGNLYGYELESIGVAYYDSQGDPLSAALYTVDSQGRPDTLVAPLAAPSVFGETLEATDHRFATPPGTVLDPGTTYAVVFRPETAGTDVRLQATAVDSEDPDGQADWSIADTFEVESAGSWQADADGRSLQIEVRGTVRTGVPGQPTGLGATKLGRYRIDLAWSAPAFDGNLPITGYRIEVSPDGVTDWTDLVLDTGSTDTADTHTPLAPSTTRHYRVSAINSAGTGDPSGSADATTDPNTPPAFTVDAANVSVPENTPANTHISGANRTATDPDGDSVTYSFQTSGGVTQDYQSFNINSASGQVQTKSPLDHEAQASYEISVVATDIHGGIDTIAYSIAVGDAAEPPAKPDAPAVTATPGSTASVEVSWAAPANAGKPPITGYDLQYRQGTSGLWTNGPQNVATTSAAIPALDGNRPYDVQVRAKNDEGDSDWSDPGSGRTANNAPVLAAGPLTLTVHENTAADIAIGAAVGASDADSDPLTYTLEGADDASFAIVETSGQIRVQAALDFEATNSYSVTVRADDGTDSDTVAVTIDVTDVDEPPVPPGAPAVAATPGTDGSLDVAWTAPANAGKPAIASYDLHYRPGTSGNWIDGPQDVAVTSAAIPDLSPRTSYQVEVRATNAEGDSDWSDHGTGSTNDPLNSAPTFANPTVTLTLPENTAGGVDIGSPVEAVDADAGDTLTYSLTGADATSFTIVASSGQIRTRSSVTYDFEAPKNSYSLSVTVTDQTANASASVTINLSDVDEPPAKPAAPALAATPGAADSLDVSWTPPANAGKPAITSYDLRYRKGDMGGWTERPSGVTTTSATIDDLDGNSSYQVEVLARNDEGASLWSDHGTGRTGNSAPVFDPPSVTLSVPENTPAARSVGSPVQAADSDSDTLEYALVGSDGEAFDIDSASGQIRTMDPLNHETKPSYSFRVRAEDGNGGTVFADVRVDVSDVNEPPATPLPPTVTATAGSNTSLTVSWTVPANAGKPAITSYDLHYRPGTSGNWINGPQNVVVTNAVIPSLSSSTSYQVEVRATNADGDSGWSDHGTGSTGISLSVITQVMGVRIVAGNAHLVVRWMAVDNATGYKVQWKSGVDYNTGDRQATVTSGLTTRYRIPNLTNGTEYTVRVIATRAGVNDGPPSAEVTATPDVVAPPPPPPPPQENNFPTADAGPDQTGLWEGALVMLDGSGSSHPEDEPLRYRWNQLSGEPVALSSQNVVNPTFTAPQGLTADAVLSFRLLVTDPEGRFDRDTVTVTVDPEAEPPPAEDHIYYFPHLAAGAGWQNTITYINYSSEEVTCRTNFLSDQGTPLMVSFAGRGTVVSWTDVLPPGGSVHEETNLELSAPLARGWARATCSGPVKASLLYRWYNSEGMPVAEAGVNAARVPATRFVTFAEQGEGQFGTGVAYANPSDTAALVTFTARDSDGEVLASEDLMLPPNGHGAQNVKDLFDLPSFSGSLEVTSTVPIVSVSLNFEADPVFSSLPPGELDAAAQGSTTYYFTHLAVGASWQTTITYINYSPQEVSCQTDFLSDFGSPLMVSFAGLGTVVSRTDVLDPGGSVHEETNVELSDPLVPGWARVTCSGPVKASLLYRRRNSEGVPTGEAGVNAARVPTTRFVTFAEQGEGQYGSGVAYANPSDTAALVTFTARDAAGQVLDSVDETLLPNGHEAQNMAPLFGLSSFSGSLEITSTEPIVSLSLNFEADPVFSSLPPGELDDAAQ